MNQKLHLDGGLFVLVLLGVVVGEDGEDDPAGEAYPGDHVATVGQHHPHGSCHVKNSWRLYDEMRLTPLCMYMMMLLIQNVFSSSPKRRRYMTTQRLGSGSGLNPDPISNWMRIRIQEAIEYGYKMDTGPDIFWNLPVKRYCIWVWCHNEPMRRYGIYLDSNRLSSL